MSAAVTVFLLIFASLLMVGALGELLFARTRIPGPLWLIAVGVVLRLAGVVDGETLGALTPYFATLTLIVVLFDGGSRIRLGGLREAAGRGTLLALATFFTTLLGVALFSVGIAALGVLEGWSFTHGLMLGAIVGGTSSLISGPSLERSGVGRRLGSLLSFEAAFTNALSAVFTIALIDLLGSGSAGAGAVMLSLAKSFGIALGLGGLIGWGWIPALRLLRGTSYTYPCTLAALMLTYVLIDVAGGSPAMGVLTFGIVVGNARAFTLWLHRQPAAEDGGVALERDDQALHAQIRFIVTAIFFAFLGMTLAPPWSLLVMGLVLGLVLLLTRLPAVFLGLRGADFTRAEVGVASINLPRGMAAGALATLPALAGIPGTAGIPILVFAAVLATIVIFTISLRGRREVSADAAPSGGHAEG